MAPPLPALASEEEGREESQEDGERAGSRSDPARRASREGDDGGAPGEGQDGEGEERYEYADVADGEHREDGARLPEGQAQEIHQNRSSRRDPLPPP